jgi:hypothetical protein
MLDQDLDVAILIDFLKYECIGTVKSASFIGPPTTAAIAAEHLRFALSDTPMFISDFRKIIWEFSDDRDALYFRMAFS